MYTRRGRSAVFFTRIPQRLLKFCASVPCRLHVVTTETNSDFACGVGPVVRGPQPGVFGCYWWRCLAVVRRRAVPCADLRRILWRRSNSLKTCAGSITRIFCVHDATVAAESSSSKVELPADRTFALFFSVLVAGSSLPFFSSFFMISWRSDSFLFDLKDRMIHSVQHNFARRTLRTRSLQPVQQTY